MKFEETVSRHTRAHNFFTALREATNRAREEYFRATTDEDEERCHANFVVVHNAMLDAKNELNAATMVLDAMKGKEPK
jgi:hypothetical protein